uniref:Gamma-glutamylcyclotransferase a n=1 Tax=Myripristis murdjan TaxID=586833 RepID=A0A667WWD2_9TELE
MDSRLKMSRAGHFMYFAFGSNLLKERLQLANPSAIFCCTGRLKDYVLKFGLWEQHVDNRWHGGVATIEFCPGEEVWGVVWTLSNENLMSLDNQEGVSQGMYSPLEVTVDTDNGPVVCRTYQMNHFHTCPPSPQYKQVFLCARAHTHKGSKANLHVTCVLIYLHTHVMHSSLTATPPPKHLNECCITKY